MNIRNEDKTGVEIHDLQERKWLYFEKKTKNSFTNYPEGLDENLMLAHAYIMGEVVELPYKSEMYIMHFNYVDWILMHPNPDEKNIRIILDDFLEKGYTERKPDVSKAMELSGHCEELVELGLIDSSCVSAFMDVVYGNHIDDTLRINKLEFDDVVVEMLKSYITQIRVWFYQKSILSDDIVCLLPIKRWVQLLYSIFIKASNRHIEEASRILRKFFDFLKNFENEKDFMDNIELVRIAKNRELVKNLRNELINSKDHYCGSLKAYVEDLRAELEIRAIDYS